VLELWKRLREIESDPVARTSGAGRPALRISPRLQAPAHLPRVVMGAGDFTSRHEVRHAGRLHAPQSHSGGGLAQGVGVVALIEKEQMSVTGTRVGSSHFYFIVLTRSEPSPLAVTHGFGATRKRGSLLPTCKHVRPFHVSLTQPQAQT
jgi:hypothetical protein